MKDLLVKYDEGIKWQLHYAKPGDVGLDLPIKIEGSKIRQEKCEHYIHPKGTQDDPRPFLEIPPRTYAELEIGVRVKLPDDSWAFITGRSSTAWKHQLTVSQGIIDTGYTGYLCTLIYNPNETYRRIYEGDRLSQLILMPKYNVENIIRVDGELPTTSRKDSGFGSTGR